MTASHQAASI